jgi:hypothetical protein
MEKNAFFSEDRKYRYVLWRIWDRKRPIVLFICLNPSTADERSDDPTIRKCMGFAQKWGYGGIILVNLFAFRATKPVDLRKASDPIGPENDKWIQDQLGKAGLIVGAWGNHGKFMGRGEYYLEKISDLCYLKMNKTGHPAHPLYLSYDVYLHRRE